MKRNILLIVADQFRADLLCGRLADEIRLPHLSELMANGVTFTNHFTTTTPCGPSRASLLTGLYSMNHRSIRNGTPLARHHTNFALEARKAGLEPLLFGYTDTSSDPDGLHPNDPDLKTYEGLAPGFAEILRLREATNYAWLADLRAKGYDLPNDPSDWHRATPAAGKSGRRISDPAPYSAADSDTAFLAMRAAHELAVRQNGGWLAMVSFIRPHPPLVAPKPYNMMYPAEKLSLPSRPLENSAQRMTHPFYEAFFSEPSNQNLFPGFDGHMDKLSDQSCLELRSIYFGLASELDDQIGRMLAELRKANALDDTLIIFTSDHGEMLGDHYQWGKNSFHDGALRIPLVICDPDNRDRVGTQVEAFTESVDLAPTFAQWLGSEIPDAYNGQSLMPFLSGESPHDWRTHIFAEIDLSEPLAPTRFEREFGTGLFDSNYALIRDSHYKYVHFNGGVPPILFDLDDDPEESRNLADDPDYQEIRIRMMQQMLDHRMKFAHRSHTAISLTEKGAEKPVR